MLGTDTTRRQVLLLLAVVLALAAHLGRRSGATDERETPSRFQTYQEFKIKFHKSYGSIAEELRRRKLFLANLLQAFTSSVKYKLKRASSFRAVNQMSDWTLAEFRSTLIPAGQYRLVETSSLVDEPDEDELEHAQLVARLLEEQQAALGVASRRRRRRKRSIEGVLEGLERLDDKVYTTTDLAVQRAIRAFYRARMARYDPSKPDELFSDHRPCLGRARRQQRCQCCHVFATMALYEWAYCHSLGGVTHDASTGGPLATRIEFSAQFMLDCGAPTLGLESWDGGSEAQVAKFAKEFGFELGARYKFTSMEATCAYDTRNATERASMGFLRLDKPQLSRVTLDKFEEQLRVSPLTVAIYASDDFSQYGGGVDEGRGCAKSRRQLHAVLLVGSGRQEGHEYWLMRNSHGDQWGERGYYKVRKDSDCLADFGSGYTLRAMKVVGKRHRKVVEPIRFEQNPDYDWHLLARRYRKYSNEPPRLPEPEALEGEWVGANSS